MRDKVIHEYFGVNLEIVWAAVEKDLPQGSRERFTSFSGIPEPLTRPIPDVHGQASNNRTKIGPEAAQNSSKAAAYRWELPSQRVSRACCTTYRPRPTKRGLGSTAGAPTRMTESP